jgi:hypothetical protein
MMVFNYIQSTILILQFYFQTIFNFSSIHKDIPSGKLFNEISNIDRDKPSTIIQLNCNFAQEFNMKYNKLKTSLRKLLKPSNSSRFEIILVASWAVRIIWAISVWILGSKALLVGLLQFLVAPMSFAVCILRFGTNAFDALLHYSINIIIGLFAQQSNTFLPSYLFTSFTLGKEFIFLFFFIDFILNLFVYFQVSEKFQFQRLLKHIVYGTFNTKTYFLIVFACIFNHKIDVSTYILTGLATLCISRTGIKSILWGKLGLPCFPVLFYVEHRIGHCPVVYLHAHKMHHFLHDTTSFDAHIYGSGMNEEFFWILVEIIPCLLFPNIFIFPYFLNLETLYFSWQNKGGHTRTSNVSKNKFGDYDYDNWHADHHTYHSANYGSAYAVILDFYFGTQGRYTKGAWGMTYRLEKHENDQKHATMHIIINNKMSHSS